MVNSLVIFVIYRLLTISTISTVYGEGNRLLNMENVAPKNKQTINYTIPRSVRNL